MPSSFALRFFCCSLALLTPLHAQVRKLHTRDMTRLSQVQVAEYLKRSDIIFIPVGAVETNGILPSDRDYVYPLAIAMTMAGQTDALYMPGLIWSYPGTTVIAPSTVYLPIESGISQLKILAKSLLRQGFRRQVYLSMSQGPAPLTAGAMVRQFYDEKHVPILYIDMDAYLPRLKLAASARDKVLFGAHYITGRLEDIPLKGDYGPAESRAAGPVPSNTGLATLSELGFSGSLFLGSWVADVMAHGSTEPLLPANAAEREAWGRQGRDQINAIVRQMRIPEAMEALRRHDRFTQEVLVPKLGKYLPAAGDDHD
ncbi:MAG: creatininase family protein [Bryobacterales bacterium]|nr:creatininase family protein [Bryobacterales bacterium]